MIDARLVWQVWRRILTSDRLVASVVDPGQAGNADDAGLSPEERAIVADYARTPVATATNIDMYRQGVARNALGALSLVPLTRHILFMSDLDLDAVADQFAESVDYFDYGPNFWQAAGAFVGYLATLPDFASPPCQDAIAIDLASVALARRLGVVAPVSWPADVQGDAQPRAVPRSMSVVVNPAASLIATRHDLADWLEFPEGFDPAEIPAEASSHWLIYFPAANAARAYVQLSARAARMVALLATPRTVDELASTFDLPVAQVCGVIDALAAAGLLLEHELPVRSDERVAEAEMVGTTV